MKSCVGILFYNDVHGLRNLIPSLLRIHVPLEDIFTVDGPFDMFEHEGQDKSTDGSREYLESMGVKIYDAGIVNHIDKTNYRLKKAAELGYDSLFVVDADEWVLGSWPDFLTHLALCRDRHPHYTYSTSFMDLDMFYDARDLHQRVFIDPGNCYYKGSHWWLFHKSNPEQQYTSWVVGAIAIIHNSSIRPGRREEQMERYAEKLVESEKELEAMEDHKPTLTVKACGCIDGYYKVTSKEGNYYKMKDLSSRCPEHKE